MDRQILLRVGTVKEVENESSYHIDAATKNEISDNYSGLRIRAEIEEDEGNGNNNNLPWCFPLLPKTFQSVPKVGEGVLVLIMDMTSPQKSQRFYIGPIISQPQLNTYCPKESGTTLLDDVQQNKPLEAINKHNETNGAFPKSSDVAVIGRGAEDIVLKFDSATNRSEIDLRAGIRGTATNTNDENMAGNIVFNNVDPAYIQLKHKKNLTAGGTENQNSRGKDLSSDLDANSVINIVADKINIISNRDDNVSDKLHNNRHLIADKDIKSVTQSLEPVPLGYVLYDFLTILKGCILHHVHPWAGMEQCGDWGGYIEELKNFDLNKIFSKHVRTS